MYKSAYKNTKEIVWCASVSLSFSPSPLLSFSLHPGYGSVIQFYPGGGPTRAGMENFGFPPHFHQTLHEFPLCKVNALLAGKLEAEGAEGGPEGAGEPQEERALDGAEGEEEAPEETQEMEVNTEGDESKEKERQERRRERKVRTGVEDFSPLVVFGTFFFFSSSSICRLHYLCMYSVFKECCLSVFFVVVVAQVYEKKVKMEEKKKKLAATAALLEGRNADG